MNQDCFEPMMVIKGNRRSVPIVPLVIAVTALFLLTRFSSLTLHQLNTPLDTSPTNQRDAPRVLDEKKWPSELPALEDQPKVPDEPKVLDEPRKEVVPETKSIQTRFCDKQNAADQGICIFDMGLNNGQDTMQYLAYSPDARVVAVEANPTLVNNAAQKFETAVAASRLKLLNIGLVGNATEGTENPKLEFWVNKANDLFSSFKQRTGCRDRLGNFMEEGDTTFCRKIEMETKSCSQLIKEYGTPVYMKIDIEGMDRACLIALGNIPQHNRPKYASIENVNLSDIELFVQLGYRGFKVVNQNYLQLNLTSKELEGHSGPWGEDAQDFWIGKDWHTYEGLVKQLPLPPSITFKGKEVRGWYDVHAKM